MKKKLLSAALVVTMTGGFLTGCGGGKTGAEGATEGKVEVPEVEVREVDPREEGLSSIFPLKEPVTLSYYIQANTAMTATMETYADVEFFKELEKQTNVHIEWIHNTNDENFALMVASGELPDLINWKLGTAAGGAAALLDDDVIMDLTEMLPQYAPNYYAWLKANPEEDKAWKMDDGRYYQFVNFNADWDNVDMISFSILGPQIRQDWLDKVGMDMPETTDELYEVLKAFKEQDVNGNGDPNDEIPMIVTGGEEKALSETLYSLAGSFGAINDFQLLDGKVTYGPTTDNFREFLKYVNKLYSEGLINTDFAVNKDAFNLVLQERGGFAINAMGSGVVATHDLLKGKNPEYNYVSVPWLKGPEGYQSLTINDLQNPRGTAVTTACKNPEIALAWLDYAYSYAGSMASTYGIEGKSYEFVDGRPTIMEEVKQNDKGWSEEQSMSRWMLGSINYPNARDKYFYEQINLNEDYKVDIQENWGKAKRDIILPPLVLNSEEQEIYSSIMSDITTYVSETNLQFITGEKDIETQWDEYAQNVENMNIKEALVCKQAAYDRYMSN